MLGAVAFSELMGFKIIPSILKLLIGENGYTWKMYPMDTESFGRQEYLQQVAVVHRGKYNPEFEES